jgi:holo-[acyl-carrier protein] synthase
MKVLGTGWRFGIAWRDVSVVRLPSGQPELAVGGRFAEVAAAMGITQWRVSLSHTESTAIASVIGLGSSDRKAT